MKPGTEAGGLDQSVDPEQRLQAGLLRRVVGLPALAEEPPAQAHETRPVPEEELRKGVAIAFPHLPNQRRVVGIRAGCFLHHLEVCSIPRPLRQASVSAPR